MHRKIDADAIGDLGETLFYGNLFMDTVYILVFTVKDVQPLSVLEFKFIWFM